jgi:allophanate hydrolase
MDMHSLALDIASLHAAYRSGQLTPAGLVRQLHARIEAAADNPVWIHLLDEAELAPYLAALEGQGPDSLPLYGVPFAIKDNIDLAGVPTTAACPGFGYTPQRSAFIVEQLVRAGAIPLGKTNLDQFATGLVGVRSPFGQVRNSFAPDYISGGSSSGSAVAVALGQVSFALGTDTAGSGRVPAGFNHLLGIKPTRGRWSTRGVVPACRSLDCPSLFALDPEDARAVAAVLDVFDPEDDYARPREAVAGRSHAPRLGVPRPEQRQFYGDAEYAGLYDAALQRWVAAGAELVEIDYQPLLDAALLLYQGPWVAERYLVVQPLLEADPGAVLPVIAGIVGQARGMDAASVFSAQYRLQALRRSAGQILAGVDALLLPTAPSHYTRAQLQADPVRLNSQLGHYTNFVNLLDMAALALPAGFCADGRPFGTTLVGPAWSDDYLLALAQDRLAAEGFAGGGVAGGVRALGPAPVAPGRIEVAVCGAHLRGMPLNHQLTGRGAYCVQTVRSAPRYRLLALAGGPPARPGMIRVAEGGVAVEMELWSIPQAQFGSFVAAIPAPLGIGKVELEDGRWVSGFICEGIGQAGALDISAYGGWRAWRAAQEALALAG